MLAAPAPRQDMVIFMGLLNDLFPGVDPPRKRDLKFEEVRGAVVPRLCGTAGSAHVACQ